MEYKIIIKEQLLNTKVLGGIGKDITNNTFTPITTENYNNSNIIACKYYAIVDNTELEVRYKFYCTLNNILLNHGNFDCIMLKGRVRDVKDIARKGDTVIFSAISLHDLNIYIKNLAKGKKVLTGTVIKTHDNYITVETDNNIVITRRECIMLSNRDDTFKCFVLD